MICSQKCHLVRREYICKHTCGFIDCTCYIFFINYYTNFLKNNVKAIHTETLEEIPIEINVWQVYFYEHYKGGFYYTLGYNDIYMFYTSADLKCFWARPIENFKSMIKTDTKIIERFKQL